MTMRISAPITLLALTVMSGFFAVPAFAGDGEAEEPTLYERLGGMDGINFDLAFVDSTVGCCVR